MKPSRFPSLLPLVLRTLLCWVLAYGMAATAAMADLRSRLESLAAENGFTVEGIDLIGPEPARKAKGTLVEQLKGLLQDYNYLVVQERTGKPEKISISSRKAEEIRGSAEAAYLSTTRVGAHHQVEATIVGPNGAAETVPLLIDTGASTLVLPESMIPDLGFSPENLQPGKSQAAGGPVPVKMGVLQTVRVGAVSVEGVEVSFVDDRKLRGTKLLGMSFLQHFRMTMDDARNELILLAK